MGRAEPRDDPNPDHGCADPLLHDTLLSQLNCSEHPVFWPRRGIGCTGRKKEAMAYPERGQEAEVITKGPASRRSGGKPLFGQALWKDAIGVAISSSS